MKALRESHIPICGNISKSRTAYTYQGKRFQPSLDLSKRVCKCDSPIPCSDGFCSKCGKNLDLDDSQANI